MTGSWKRASLTLQAPLSNAVTNAVQQYYAELVPRQRQAQKAKRD